MVGGWVDPIGKSPTKVFASLVAQWIDLRSPARHKTIYGYRDYREYGRTSIEPIERLKISEICVLPLPRATIYPHIFNSIWQNLCNNFCVGFQRLEDIGNAQINLPVWFKIKVCFRVTVRPLVIACYILSIGGHGLNNWERKLIQAVTDLLMNTE